MQRNYDKLLDDFRRRYFVKHGEKKAGQLYFSDYQEIKTRAEKRTADNNGGYVNMIYNCIDIALQAGVMIGYNAARSEARAKHERV